MTKIADSFCGYINVDNDTFAYSVSHQTVTLLPAHEKDTERHMILDRFLSRNTGLPRFLYGTEAQTQIAIFCNGRLNTDFLRLNSLIEELKAKIKDTISEFTNSHPELDVSTETTLPSAFQYLDYTLKQKFLTLYSENHDIVDAITSKWGMPQVNETSIGKFVKLRNSKTHTGIAKMDDAAQLYIPLRALAYVCLFRYIGLPYEAVKCIIQKVFL